MSTMISAGMRHLLSQVLSQVCRKSSQQHSAGWGQSSFNTFRRGDGGSGDGINAGRVPGDGCHVILTVRLRFMAIVV